jgi:DNA-binding NtrC family response regulator
MPRRILFLDTPEGDLEGLASSFLAALDGPTDVDLAHSESELLERLGSGPAIDLVVVDYFLGDGRRSGDVILAAVRGMDPDLPIVAVAERGDVESAARAIRDGAVDFLVRGARIEDRVTTLLAKVTKLLRLRERNRRLSDQNAQLLAASAASRRMVGRSPQFVEMLDRVRRIATIPRPVLIVGERGTGKELVARVIHSEAGPGDHPMVTVNCAAFPDTLLESELFGHEKGAFTGADRATPGRFEQADGGTLFLDEIGNMSISFQQKILRVVEYGVFSRVGGREEIRTTARVIAATNVDLDEHMRNGLFLRDLYDRLSFEVIRVPPLRERPEDIEELAHHFLGLFAREVPAFREKRLSARALTALRGYPFPGNARELKNLIERAAFRDTTNEITPEDLGLPRNGERGNGGGTFKERVETFERRLIERAMEDADGNQAQAARALGLSYHQFRYYHRKLLAP